MAVEIDLLVAVAWARLQLMTVTHRPGGRACRCHGGGHDNITPHGVILLIVSLHVGGVFVLDRYPSSSLTARSDEAVDDLVT